jgi:hypothetical protein
MWQAMRLCSLHPANVSVLAVVLHFIPSAKEMQQVNAIAMSTCTHPPAQPAADHASKCWFVLAAQCDGSQQQQLCTFALIT